MRVIKESGKNGVRGIRGPKAGEKGGGELNRRSTKKIHAALWDKS